MNPEFHSPGRNKLGTLHVMALLTGIIGAATRPEVEARFPVESIPELDARRDREEAAAIPFLTLPATAQDAAPEPVASATSVVASEAVTEPEAVKAIETEDRDETADSDESAKVIELARPEPTISERSYTLVGRAMRVVMKTFSPSVWQSILRKLAEQLPEKIELTSAPEVEWDNRSRHDQFVEELVDQGFQDAGIFAVESMNTKVHLLVNEAYDIRAVLYEHEDSGIVLDLVTLFGDGTGVTYVNRQDPGIEQSPLHPNVYRGDVPVFELLDDCLRERPKKARIPETAAAAPRLMELEYAFGTRRLRGAPVNPIEVADAYLDALEQAAAPRSAETEAAAL